MRFLRSKGGYSEIRRGHDNYRRYLRSVKDRMAANAYAFATAPWHYDPQDHRCLHDWWVDELAIYEGDDTGSGARGADILVRLLGPHHDRRVVLEYAGVSAYGIHGTLGACAGEARTWSHGDWLLDEVTLSDSGHVLHEVEFSSGARWIIECTDITCAVS